MGTNEQLLRQLNRLCGTTTLIVGIGNTLKADDGAGPLVCQQLQRAKISANLIDAGTVPENYIQRIIKKAPQNLLILDAVDFGASPGTIEIFKPEQLSSLIISTHTLSPRIFVDMIQKSIDVDVYFLGIQPAQTQLGQPLSDEVNYAIQNLTDILTQIFPQENKRCT